jgi:hypothetical protein
MSIQLPVNSTELCSSGLVLEAVVSRNVDRGAKVARAEKAAQAVRAPLVLARARTLVVRAARVARVVRMGASAKVVEAVTRVV